MDPLTGAVVAGVVAWVSILVAGRLPSRWLPVHRLRPIGGVSLALLGLVVLGFPLPGWLPAAVLLVGLLGIVATVIVTGRPAA